MKFLVYILLIIGLLWIDLCSGSSGWLNVSLLDLFSDSLQGIERTVVMDVRLPAALTAMLAGGGLAVAGLLMQVLFRNPLAGPGVMGVSSGAGLFVSLAILAGVGFGVGTTLMAVLGSMITLLIIVLASLRLPSNTSVLILGLMIGYVASALISMLQYSADADRLQHYIYWTLGSFQSVSWNDLIVLIPLILVALFLTYVLRAKLDLLLLGEEHIVSLGIEPRVARIPSLIITGVLVGTITAYCGPLAFIGLAAPHIARMITPSDIHVRMIPHTLAVGILIGLAALAVVNAPFIGIQIPLNAVLSVFGAPVVIWLLLRKSHLSQLE